MSKEIDKPTELPAPVNNPALTPDAMAAFAAMIGTGVQSALEAHRPSKVPFGRFDPKTPFHPEKAKAPRFTRIYTQNGHDIAWETCHDEEVRMLNAITHSGRYLDRKVEVIVTSDGPDESVDVRWPCKTQDQRTAMATHPHGRSFLTILQEVVRVQREEDAEDELERQTRPRGTFGNNRNTREARERAGVS